MKYYLKTVKEVRHFLDYEVEASSIEEAKNKVWDLEEEGIAGNEIESDCTYFEILETKLIEE